MTRPRLSARALAALPIALTMPGCAARDASRYPSLLPRAIETRGAAEPTAATSEPDPATPDPATDTKLTELRGTLDAANMAFDRAADSASGLADAARRDVVGSDRWIAAQTALAELDGDRATTSSVLVELDELAIGRAADGKPDYPALVDLRSAAQAALDAQTARTAAIQARLPAA